MHCKIIDNNRSILTPSEFLKHRPQYHSVQVYPLASRYLGSNPSCNFSFILHIDTEKADGHTLTQFIKF